MLAFTTGTINEPDAGSVGLSMVEQMRDDIVAHAAWELVEEFTPAAGEVRWYVFKCLGTENGYGIDFFAVIGRTLGNGELRVSICEGYNAGTHTMSYFPVEYAYGTFDEFGRDDTHTFVLGTTQWVNGTADGPAWVNWSPSGTSTKWWNVVAEDGFSTAFSGASNGFFHIGGYHYLGQIGNDLPIQVSGGWENLGYITRNPAIAGETIPNNYSQCMSFHGATGGNPGSWYVLGFQGKWQFDDKLQNDQRPVAEVALTMSGADSGTYADYPEKYGWALGKHKRMRQSYQVWPAGITFGDAFALNGTLWVPCYTYTEDGRIFDTGVAS